MMNQKNFKEIYDNIYADVGQKVDAKRKEALFKRVIVIILAFAFWFIMLMSGCSLFSLLVPFGLLMTVIIVSFLDNKISKGYKRDYKEQIINEIVKQSNSEFKYFYEEGISSNIYYQSGFDRRWDIYKTEDLIEGKMEDGISVTMAQVHTQDKETSTDSNGHTTTSYVTTFLGLFGVITLNKATTADFMIKNNSKFAKFDKNRIEMESAEFEKYYDVYSNYLKGNSSRQNTMEILTPETIEEFVKIRNMFKRSINVRVCQDKIYFRIAVGDIFEPPTFKSTVNFDMLYRYFLIIDVPRMLYETMIDNINLMYRERQ